MKRTTVIFIAATLALLPLSSCIKENRNDCPCWIEFDFSHLECRNRQDVYTSVWDERNPIHTVFRIMPSSSYVVQLGKGTHEVTCFTGVHNSRVSNGVVTIPKGFQADSLLAYTQRVECVEETSYCVPLPHRQFATVNMTIVDSNLANTVTQINILSDIAGLDCRTITPRKGELEFSLMVNESNEYRFRVPRQTLSSTLDMEFVNEDGTSETLPLGSWILASGYDWYAADLEEVDVVIDKAESKVTVSIAGWTGGSQYIVDL